MQDWPFDDTRNVLHLHLWRSVISHANVCLGCWLEWPGQQLEGNFCPAPSFQNPQFGLSSSQREKGHPQVSGERSHNTIVIVWR